MIHYGRLDLTVYPVASDKKEFRQFPVIGEPDNSGANFDIFGASGKPSHEVANPISTALLAAMHIDARLIAAHMETAASGSLEFTLGAGNQALNLEMPELPSLKAMQPSFQIVNMSQAAMAVRITTNLTYKVKLSDNVYPSEGHTLTVSTPMPQSMANTASGKPLENVIAINALKPLGLIIERIEAHERYFIIKLADI